MAPAQQKKLDATSYHVAWICAVADLELIPALLMLDEFHERPDIDNRYDDNTYKFGTMAGHNVVVATCPDAMASQVNVCYIVGPLFKTFTSIRMTLLVGIGGGVPQKHLFSQPLKDVHLGDVVVGWPSHADGKPAVIYYDSGRSLMNGFQPTTHLNKPHMVLLKALPFVRTDHTMGNSNFDTYLDRLQNHEEFGDQYKHPGLEHDLLFKSTYEHVGGYNSYCVDCDKTNLVERSPRADSQRDKFVYHQGRIATGNSVIQDGRKRDSINDQHGDVFCIEMEAAGVDINSSCLVIRGISDYADSHKSDMWRSYAAGKAVVFARELLGNISPADVKNKMTSGNKHWLVNRSTNPYFTGRREIIDSIVIRVTSEDAANEQRRFVLTGMGGQGKSEICLHVANEVRERFWGIFWVDVSTPASADENFSEVAEALGCSKSVDAVRKSLSSLSPSKKWLLILDNADDPEQDYQIYIPSGSRGSILMTSRNAGCGYYATDGGHGKLEHLGNSECVELFYKTAKLSGARQSIRSDADILVKELGHHTLAILHAGSYIATGNRSIAEYLELLRTNRRKTFELSGGQGQKRYDTVYATIGASMDYLKSSETNESETIRKDALDLLQVLSTFHHESIPLDIFADAWKGAKKASRTPKHKEKRSEMLNSWHVARLPHLLRQKQEDVKFRISEAVARLESLALVRTDPARMGIWKCVSIHPLVHGWVGDRYGEREKKKITRTTICIVALSKYGNSQWTPYTNHLGRHLKAMGNFDSNLVDGAAKTRCILQVCVQFARIYYSGRLCRDMHELTSHIFERLGLDDRGPTKELRAIYFFFAIAVREIGIRPMQSVQVFEAIARLDKKTRPENDGLRLYNLRNLGTAYIANGQTQRAVSLLREVVKARERPGERHRPQLAAQHDLAKALLEHGDLQEAIKLIEHVVKSRNRPLSANDPDQLASQQVLAVAYLKDGQVTEAMPLLEEVTLHLAQDFGIENPKTAAAQTWLANAYLKSGRVSEGMALFGRVVLDLDGKDHVLLASRHEFAAACLGAGMVHAAVDVLEQVVRIKSAIYEDGHTCRKRSMELLDRAHSLRTHLRLSNSTET